MNKQINIMYQSDDNYAVYMGVSILSLLINNPDISINIYVIDMGIKKDNKCKLVDLVNKYRKKIIFLPAELVIKSMQYSPIAKYSSFRKNKTSYCKMFISKLLPKEVERILYIDCDTLILNEIPDINSIDMEGHPVGMVLDAYNTKRLKESIGFNESDLYYNSGVILYDTCKWKEKKCEEKIFTHAQEGNVYGTVDQDYLNVVLKNDIKTLDIKLNFQSPYYTYKVETFESVFKKKCVYYTNSEINEAKKRPIIMHFLRLCGESPWHVNTVHPAKKYFVKYYSISPWKDKPLPVAKLSIIFKIEIILYRCLPQRIFCRIFKIVHDQMLVKSKKNK